MKKKFIFLLVILSLSNSYANANNLKTIASLEKGGKLVFIRHAIAPGGGDPDDFDVKDCSSQRNLNQVGVNQAKRIGNFFRDNKILIDQVLSSEWCRCKDTAYNAFIEYKTFNPLNSYFSPKFYKNKDQQVKNLRNFVSNWDSEKNIVFITHYIVISDVLGISVNSGTIIVADKNFKVIGTIDTK